MWAQKLMLADISNGTAISERLTFRPMNDTDTIYEGNTTKQFIFVPQVNTKEYYDKSIYDITVSVVTSDETSIDFVTKVLFIDFFIFSSLIPMH
jgi:hypothetical protein